MSEHKLEVTETELDETQNPAAEPAEGSAVESAAPDFDGAADAASGADDTAADEADADEAAADEAEAEADADGEDSDALAAAAAKAEVDPAEEFKAKLRRQEGDWYVIHSYAGYENRVKSNIETRTQSLNMEDYIFQVEVPTHHVTEVKSGKRQ
ncbi:MAG: transcription termination/antitermination factor NusG, partial [Actinomycetota bacterium]|nr:transcription termination/antitermination factor NusG [Actinomycetota bacterium]